MKLARSRLRSGAVLFIVLFLVGCGGTAPGGGDGEAASGGETTSGREAASGESSESSESLDATCDLRVVEHKYGRAEIDGSPERVVSLTSRDQDTALSLGVVPIAITDGFYEEPWTSSPWVRDELRAARTEGSAASARFPEPEILPLGGELNYERIAGLQPDLILARGSGITERDYDILSQIAPTVAQSADFADFGAPWQEITRTLGRALCRESRANEQIVEVEEALRAVRENHPELMGASAAVALPGGPEGSYWVYGPQDSRVRFLATLGLEIPSAIARVTGDRFAATISAERLDLVDRDVLIWMGTAEQEATVRENPLYQRLEVAREDRHVFLRFDGVLTAAWTNTSPLNIPYLIDELVPRITAALQESARTAEAHRDADGDRDAGGRRDADGLRDAMRDRRAEQERDAQRPA